MLDVQPLGRTFAARLVGVDVTRLDEEAFARLRQAFLEHHVISIPGQGLLPQTLLAFSRRLGPLERHVLRRYHHPEHPEIIVLSNVREGDAPKGLADAGTYWHSDNSYKARPSAVTVLYALEVPEAGGDTLFTDMVAAYDDLPGALKQRLEGRRAVHDYAWRNDELARELGIREPLSEAQRRETPPVSHPVVRTHPVTGRKALYVNPGFTRCIEGLPEAESRSLLEEVFGHCLQERYRFRYRWRPGDLVLWDNAAVMHSATTRDLDPARRRTLWRTIVSGDAPV